ncbi:unnamed protein product [Paramecium sonneborni]|uniref:Uncharacterized protein n=1 Tax=Paramecium sonneborni TaxID=65129 RepID=A0A8S1PNM6_9CILI|nr:unnamed protein product [Paramecium sonneborni]
MLKALQQRVSDIKKQENWKDKLDQEDMKQEQREPDMYNTINQSLGKMMKPNQYILKKLKIHSTNQERNKIQFNKENKIGIKLLLIEIKSFIRGSYCQTCC